MLATGDWRLLSLVSFATSSMGDLVIRAAEAVAVAFTVAGIGYYLVALWSARNFLKYVPAPDGFTPPVTILKPLRGADPEMYEAFRSQCLQDYPEYELIFGVSNRAEPAVELVERLMRDFPGRAIRLAVCPEARGANTKVSNLAYMAGLARHQYLIVSDSDIRVAPDYLRRVLAPLGDPAVGMVTCLYRGMPHRTLGSKLEALGIETDFAPGVLVARRMEGVHFGLGSTMAFPRRALQAIGGFEAFADYLADDFELGRRIAAAGLKIRLSEIVVDHHLPEYSFRAFFRHQLRWARGIRDSRPWGYAGLVFTFGLPWAIVAWLLAKGAAWAWGLLAVTLGVRLAMAAQVTLRVLRHRESLRLFWLIPLRDLAAAAVWLASYAGHRVAWRGEEFILEKGKLRRVEAAARRRSPVAS